MRIGIDMRMAGTGEGIARYTEELVRELANLDQVNEYFLIHYGEFPISNFQFPKNFQSVQVKSKYYSWMEQTYFIHELNRLYLDLMHFTSFNIPIFYQGKFTVTIHDIIHHQFPGRKKSRYLHRAGYRTVIWTAVNRAEKVIAVSKATKEEMIKTFAIPSQKITVIYEGASRSLAFPENSIDILKRHGISKPFLLFVGVWRQYKNLPKLAESFDILREQYKIDCQLVLAGKIDEFYPEIKEAVFAVQNREDIRALGFVTDDDLAALYKEAKVFVLPSLIEGFGLIGIEAQSAGKPVAASNIPVLREILGDGAVYFDPHKAEDMAKKISEIWNDPKQAEALRQQARDNAKRFDWKETAAETLELYKTLA